MTKTSKDKKTKINTNDKDKCTKRQRYKNIRLLLSFTHEQPHSMLNLTTYFVLDIITSLDIYD